MNHRTLLALAAVIFAAGYFVRSFQPANAFPQGPNVSLGSNPIDHDTIYCDGTDSFTNASTSTFIITDLITYNSGGYTLSLFIDGNIATSLQGNPTNDVTIASGLKVNPGQVITCTGSQYRFYTISGYYTH